MSSDGTAYRSSKVHTINKPQRRPLDRAALRSFWVPILSQ